MLKRLLTTRELGIILVLALEVGFFAWRLRRPEQPNLFLQTDTVLSLVRDSAVLGLAAIGACIVIISGGIDLSVGSVIALVTVVTASLLRPETGWPLVGAVAVGLLAGTACGLASAAVICRAALPPFIVTLGMMSIARGLAYLITRGRTITLPDSPFTQVLGAGTLNVLGLAVPMPAAVLVAVATLAALLMSRTALGRSIFAVGGNEEAARLSGVRVTRVKHVVYGLAGLAAGLAGCVFAAYFGTGQSTAAAGWELDAIAAAVVGGASLSGGRGSVAGACIGAVLFRVLDRGLTMLNASDYKQVITGLVVVGVVVVDQLATQRARRLGGRRGEPS
jgi:ribose/xylose/arabinose/galactoside ABC-type transport system permease subunit